ncbi:GerAB/ArcD/ProY family transporter [Tepidibacter hydrothermalis]|uniref:Endospore germination permease n=1 Tax=Tepidibacter hydrothermalis TaxID=3036126 RepID=A0ABY8EDW8_9FIRM|nr:endospore germination permease [Tepidibacter hydrothermalis]WFD11135.1 endospore germination permease [Tepidibacter hydrothermalis]
MKTEIISDKEGICLITMFVIGTSGVIVTGLQAKQDLWLSVILSIFMAFCMAIIYARLNCIFKGENLFYILEICFGNIIGKLIGLLYVWYTLHLSCLILRDFGEFQLVVLKETPMMVTMMITAFLGIWVLKDGIEVMGRYAKTFAPLIVIVVLTLAIMVSNEMQITNLQPILSQGFKPIMDGAFSAFSFPFGEIVIFTMVFSKFKNKKFTYNVYVLGLLISGSIIFITSTAEVLILGVNTCIETYFPGYVTVGKLDIGDVLQRLEIITTFIFILGGFIKFSVCLLASVNGIAKIFELDDYRFIVTPMSYASLNLAYITANSRMSFFDFSLKIYPYYAFPFQVIIPLILWIIAESRHRKSLNN